MFFYVRGSKCKIEICFKFEINLELCDIFKVLGIILSVN